MNESKNLWFSNLFLRFSINFFDSKYSPWDAQWMWIILSPFVKDLFSFLKLFLLPIIPFSIFFEKRENSARISSDILIKRKLILYILKQK